MTTMFTEEELAKEEWRDIPGYEGIYLVSNLGRIKSQPRHGTKVGIRKLRKHIGYWGINLTKDGITKHYLVHRLVALAFISNPQNLPCINHKDESRDNNRVENLEWCTHKYNLTYGTARKRQKESRANNPNDKLIRKRVAEKQQKPVKQFSLSGELIAIYPSMKDAVKATGMGKNTILRHCHGLVGKGCKRYVKPKKYIFKFA